MNIKVKCFYILFFLFILFSITTSSYAKMQNGYVPLKNDESINKGSNLNIATPVTYSVHLESVTNIECSYNGSPLSLNDSNSQMSINNKGWIMCKLPSTKKDRDYTIPGEVKIIYKNAAFNSLGQYSDVEVKIDNIRLFGLKKSGERSGAKFISIYRCVGKLWVEFYCYKSCSETNNDNSIMSSEVIANGVAYDVSVRIINANEKNTFVFSAEDIDIPANSSNHYGDNSEGISFLSGLDKSKMQITNNSYLYGKYENNILTRITGSQTTIDDENSGFTIIANASGMKYLWRAGHSCGTSFVSIYQPPIEKLEVLRTVKIYFKDTYTRDYIPNMPVRDGETGTCTRPIIPKYVYIGVELTKPKAVPMNTSTSVEVLNDNKDYEIIFWYVSEEHLPRLVFGDPDPNLIPLPNYKELKNKIREADNNKPQGNVLLYTNDLNNQCISNYPNGIWVLEEEGKIIVRYAATKARNPVFDLEVRLPFNVKYEGKTTNLISKKNIKCTNFTLNGEPRYIGYQYEINGISIPLKTLEKNYEKGIIGKIVFKCDELACRSVIGTEKASIGIVGAVYDFKVTNLDGSSMTGDGVWSRLLFENNNEYDVKTLPIGQVSTVVTNKGYNYGVKKGTKFYFSLNTKGYQNSQIEIIPKYYYYSSDGEKKVEVYLYEKNILTTLRRTSIKDSNRTKNNYVVELLKGINLYRGNYANRTPQIGNYKKITIGAGLRMPFVNYGIDMEKYDEYSKVSDSSLKYVSHWYGDFLVPNNAIFYTVEGNKRVPENGYIVVCFSIKTKDEKEKDYLAYNLATPFNQNEKESEWNYEKGKSSRYIVLPNGKATNVIWNNTLNEIKTEGYVPVIIYQNNISTTLNVNSAGTH